MIETRYALKYSMPHSLVHIVDNSQYTGPLPVITAEDPSLLASIVVTGAPMGADNKMITINRSDVLGVAYGMANITSDDIKRYGQAVTYPGSLIAQGGPVRFMRVTPDDATYAVSSLVVQWRIDGTDNKLHVRFKVKDWPEDLQRDRFKNTARVNEALVKYFKSDNAEEDASGAWSQRSFINFIAAGRGSAYNKMANAINMTSQPRRPANVRYEFATIDTTTNSVVERFFASLVNVNNKDRADAIDSVNTVVSKRLEGSSITVPYVNDAAVREVYKIYMDHYKNMLDVVEPNEFISNAYKAMNINIFDMIFGNYIYNGTDTSTKMPFYQVDMFSTEVPKVDEERRLCVLDNTIGENQSLWDPTHPEVLYDKILASTYGVSRTGDAVHVGDIYLSSPSGNSSNPRISVITSINQYTGSVTSMTIPRVYPLDKADNYQSLRKDVGTGKASVVITTILDDVKNAGTDSATSAKVDKLVSQGAITDSSVVAAYRYDATNNNAPLSGFDMYTVAVEDYTDPSTGILRKSVKLYYMDPKFYYEMLDRNSHSGGMLGTGNAMGFWYSSVGESITTPDAAWNRVGATVVIQETVNVSGDDYTFNRIYVNSYERTSADDEDPDLTKNRVLVAEAATYGIIGTPPTSVSLTDDLIGSQFDVKVYNETSIDKWKVSGLTIDPATTIGNDMAFKAGDQLYVAIRANANSTSGSEITPGSASDPEMYTIKTADESYIAYWSTTKGSPYLTEAPANWNTTWNTYSKYDTTTKRIVPLQTATYTKLTAGSAPADWPDAEAEAGVSAKYYADANGTTPITFTWNTDHIEPAYAANTFYEKTLSPTEAPEFSADLKVLSGEFMEAWTAVPNKADSIDVSNCGTIITVSSVNSVTGEITGFNISKNAGYNNADASILSVITNSKIATPIALKAVLITGDTTDPRIAGLQPTLVLDNFVVTEENSSPAEIKRYTITGSAGSLFRVQSDPTIIPANYYSDTYGVNPTSEVGGIRMDGGYTGFFDDTSISDIEFKWRYSALLVNAFRGLIDPRIQSPTRCPAKFLFDAAYNTIVGSTILPYLTYTPADIINASTIFTEDEKEEILYHPEIIAGLKYEDVDVKQAMYDLMIYRVYQGIPEDKRPIGPGSGLSLLLDSGVTDANTAMLVNTSFNKRFDNPNASWDIGGWNDVEYGVPFTFSKQVADNLINHIRTTSINKPYVGRYSEITPDRYTSYFPDVDTTDWELRELLYNSGGNAWIMDANGNLTRRSQRTLIRDAATSDLLQESNMRTLSQLTYLLQNKVDSFLLEYNDDAVIKTLSDEVNNIFSNWVGNLVDALDITFVRDINTDGGEILICYCNVTFRGLILRVPIIVNVNRREYNS